VLRALEKNRDRRFSSAREFADALERVGPDATEIPAEAPPERPRAGRNPLVPVLLAGGGVAAAIATGLYILQKPAAPYSAPPAIATFAAPLAPTAAPTAGPDEIVIAPRIVEQPSPSVPSPVPPTRAPTARSVPTAAPPTPAAASPPEEEAEDPLQGPVTAARFRKFLDQWTRRPIERRAHRALEIAHVASFWAATHPDDPFAPELKTRLPRMLRFDTEAALSGGQPALARLFWRAYRQLKFSPPDPELAERVRRAVP
jgi:hypothetical protein